MALVAAHSHNDYYRSRPLADALDRGFASIEADVFVVDGELLVGHYTRELRPERTLEALYLAPLRKHVAAHGGRVFAGPERLTLLVDFKNDGAAAYAALATLLAKYDDLVSGLAEGTWRPRGVDVVVTGDRPVDAIRSDRSRRVGIDGRFNDTPPDAPADLTPLISENWRDHFRWRGVGEMPPDEQQRLAELVERAHGQGRRLRFWGAADSPAVWTQMRRAGVDVLGTDNLDALEQFLRRP